MGNRKKWANLSSWSILMFLLIAHYQNCGSPKDFAVHEALDPSAPEQTIIDDSTTTTALTFLEKSIQVFSDAPALEAQGACFAEQDGATLNWALFDPQSDDVVELGQTDCHDGGFKVAINDLQGIECGREYMIQARLGLGQAGQVSVVRACD